MYWNIKSIDTVEQILIERDAGGMQFISELNNIQSPLSRWLTHEDHFLLQEAEYVAFLYLTEVILKSIDYDWKEIARKANLGKMVDIENELWDYNVNHKKTKIEERFNEYEILAREKDLHFFIEEFIEDFKESAESHIESIVDEFLRISSLMIAASCIKIIHKTENNS